MKNPLQNLKNLFSNTKTNMQTNKPQISQSQLIVVVIIFILVIFVFMIRQPVIETNNAVNPAFLEAQKKIETEIITLRNERATETKLKDDFLKDWKKKDREYEAQINELKEKLRATTKLTEKQSTVLNFSGIPTVSAGGKDPEINSGWQNSWTVDGTPVSTVPQQSNGTHCSIGTGSHDVRHLAYKYPWVAGWKNNQTSGITRGSKELEQAFTDAGIKWFRGTNRPANEWSWYYGFADLENGMKAKMLVIRRSYKNATIRRYLSRWGTDYIPTKINKSRTIGSLNDSELIELMMEQIKKESGVAMRDYVRENVIVCE